MAAGGRFADGGEQGETYILVTGTNSGLGFSICCRLIDEFLSERPETESLILIFTTRSSKKSRDTLSQLQNHLYGSHPKAPERVTLQPEHVDLGDLMSVRALARRLLTKIPKLDVLVLNAGIAGFTGIDWFGAIYLVLTDIIPAVTWPASFCRCNSGVLVKKQTHQADEPSLGEVFCANVFGHYMLSHGLMPLLSRSQLPARIIWTSSLEATRSRFDVSDIQGIHVARSYESSKYLTDILALTSNLPSTSKWVNSFLSSSHTPESEKDSSNQTQDVTKPNLYVAHPGICATSIVPLALPLVYAMVGAFWIARMIGSPWHVISSYAGSCASVWLSLAPQSVLDAAEGAYERLGGGKVKWGSSCDRSGRTRPVCTEVEGWGYGGLVGGAVSDDDRRRRRKPGAEDLTAEEKVEFEELGRKCWKEMEELRVRWEGILDKEEERLAN